MIEWIVTTIIFEKLRTLFKRKHKNNIKAIREMQRNMPIFETVGELRELLNNFNDDVRISGGSFRYPMLQIREVNGEGIINMASSSHKE